MCMVASKGNFLRLSIKIQLVYIHLSFERLRVGCDLAFRNSSPATVGVIVYRSDGVIHDGIEKKVFVKLALKAKYVLVVREACLH